MITKQKQMIPNVEIAVTLARRMRQDTAQDKIGLARTGLIFLKQIRQEEMVNGNKKQVEQAAYLLARVLAREYANPGKAMEAASIAGELRAFARSITPFGKASIDLMTTPCLMG